VNRQTTAQRIAFAATYAAALIATALDVFVWRPF
jgi:hypothetical protein